MQEQLLASVTGLESPLQVQLLGSEAAMEELPLDSKPERLQCLTSAQASRSKDQKRVQHCSFAPID